MKIKFKYIILLLALSVAGCAGYFSVWGLSQLFAGASVSVIIMASLLEIGKVITTTALHKFWNKIPLNLKIYLMISVGILMLITSAGIYGFLSNAYQKTAYKLETQSSQIEIINNKKQQFELIINNNQSTIDSKNKRIEQLSLIRIQQESRLDNSTTNKNRDKTRNDITSVSKNIDILSYEIDSLKKQNIILLDSINKFKLNAITIASNSDISAEIGPLRFISQITGISMAKVVNFVILLLIFVFDPLALALIIITSKVFDIDNNTTNIIATNDISPIDDKSVSIPVDEKSSQSTETNGLKLEDIKEIKNRGYSVNVPQPKKSNIIERIGSNKVIKDGNNDTIFYSKEKND